ncbi:site-specific recombinase XerD [Pseudonocardia eucalypti]|nr:site-specific recombinase XerD [Pseudonocardia eucalypti]
MLKDFGQVGRWLVMEGLDVGELDEQRMAAFLDARCARGQRRVGGPRSMRPVLSYLREAGVVAEPAGAAPSPLASLLERYRCWMIQERNLAPATVLRYENTARRFLREQAMVDGVFTPSVLTGADVNAFLLRECARVSAGSAKGRVAELRSVLRFLYLREITSLRLGAAVPPVGGWRLAGIPKVFSGVDTQLLLHSCDRDTEVGVRNFAIIMLVARLGLRSIEIARLELDDIDWRAGELLVRGKARRQDRLPLPVDVGEALVAYLSRAHRVQPSRRLFLTCRAPRAPIRADLVGDVVERACLRAGVTPVGPHRLRHALAGGLLRRGASLAAISRVLRHQDLATTALYAKVDLGALRTVALPWPGATR